MEDLEYDRRKELILHMKKLSYTDSDASKRQTQELYDLASHMVAQDDTPDPALLIHAARTIISPSLQHGLIPKLLLILTNIESFRIFLVNGAREMLESESAPFPESRSAERHALEKSLKRHCQAERNWRDVYAQLLCQFCTLDVYTRLTMPHSPEQDLMIRLREYFPSLRSKKYAYGGQRAPNRIHLDLSEDEKDDLIDAGKDCYRFIRNTYAWALEHEAEYPGLTAPKIVCTQECQNATGCSCPIREDELLTVTVSYLNAVLALLTHVEDICGPVPN